MQSTYMRGESRVNKTWELFYIDLFIKNAIENGVVDIKLVKFPITRNHNGKDQSDGRMFDNKTKGFRVINTFLLGETSSN